MKATYNTISELEAAIAVSTNTYKVKDLKERLSWLKAKEAGKFVTKAHLTELRGLIISVINKSLYFKGIGDNVKKVMTQLLNDVEANILVYRTEKGIKGIVLNQVKLICKEVNCDYVTKVEGSEVLTNANLRVEGTLYYKVQQFNLNM